MLEQPQQIQSQLPTLDYTRTTPKITRKTKKFSSYLNYLQRLPEGSLRKLFEELEIIKYYKQ